LIEALYQMGRYYESVNNVNGLLSVIENPNEHDKYKNLIVLKFKDDNGKLFYDGIDLEEFSDEKIEKVVYKKGPPNGGNYTPTLLYTTIDKVIKNISKPIKKIESDLFEKLYECINEDEIKKLIENDIKNIVVPKEGHIITLKINDKWLNEFPKVTEKLISQNSKKYIERKSFLSYEKVSKAEEKVCFVCKNKVDKVYGFVNTFNFYTLDKKGFMTGGFNRKYAWRNYPVCPKCAETLENGKKFLKNNFNNRFAGFSYFIIPKFLFDTKNIENQNKYKRIMNSLSKNEKIVLGKGKNENLFREEDKILKYLSKENNFITVDIMFYKEDKAAFGVLKNIEDILPSRLNKVFKAKEKIDKANIFDSIIINKDKKNTFVIEYYFDFSIIREFFPNSKIEGVYDNTFLEVINSIFIDKKIDRKFMILSFMNKIRKEFVSEEHKDYKTEDLVKKSFLINKFLIELDLFKSETKKGGLDLIVKNEKNELYLNFFEEHEDVFDTNLKRGTFLVGVLANKLLSLPEQSNKPFYARLNSLKMDEKIIKRIIVESINKLNEYGKNYYVELEKLMSEYLTLANFRELSKDELSYYFVTGMNLGKIFKKDKTIEGDK